MFNIASYQEGYTDGFSDGKNKVLNDILKIWNNNQFPEYFEDDIGTYLENCGLIPSKEN